MNDLTSRELKLFNTLSYARNREVHLGDKIQEVIDKVAIVGTPVNALEASGTLTLTGNVSDGEKILINSQIYEFVTDDAKSVGAPGTIAIDIVENTVKAMQSLILGAQPSADDTMIVGSKHYIFVAHESADSDGDIDVGEDKGSAQLAIIAAINGTDGYNTPHPLVTISEFSPADEGILVAIFGGSAANSIPTTAVFDDEDNFFDGITMVNGADCSAANAKTAIIAEINTHDTQGVAATSGAGTTVTLTADTPGVTGNEIATGTQLANGSFGHATLTGGLNGTVTTDPEVLMFDSTYLYQAVAANTITGKNWRRIALGSAY